MEASERASDPMDVVPEQPRTLHALLQRAFAPDVAIGTRHGQTSVYTPEHLLPAVAVLADEARALLAERAAYAAAVLPLAPEADAAGRGGITGAQLVKRAAPGGTPYRARLDALARAAGPATAEGLARRGAVVAKSIDLSALTEGVRVESLNELLVGYRAAFLAYRRRTPHLTLLLDWNVRVAPPPPALAPQYADTLSMADAEFFTPDAIDMVGYGYDYRYDDARRRRAAPAAEAPPMRAWVAPDRTEPRANGDRIVLDLYAEPLDQTLSAGLAQAGRDLAAGTLALDALVRDVTAALFQVVQALSAGFVDQGLVHHDLHTGNVMLHALPPALRNARWLLYFDRPITPRLHAAIDAGDDAADPLLAHALVLAREEARPLLNLQPHGPTGRRRIPFGSDARGRRALAAAPPRRDGPNWWADAAEWEDLLGVGAPQRRSYSAGQPPTVPPAPPDTEPLAQMYALPRQAQLVKLIDFGRARLLANASDARPLAADYTLGPGEVYASLGISTALPDPTHDLRVLAWSLAMRDLPRATFFPAAQDEGNRAAARRRAMLVDFLGTALGGAGLAELLAGEKERRAGSGPASEWGRVGRALRGSVLFDEDLGVPYAEQEVALAMARALYANRIAPAAHHLLETAGLLDPVAAASAAGVSVRALTSKRWTPEHNVALLRTLVQHARARDGATGRERLAAYFLQQALQYAVVYLNYVTEPPSRFRNGVPMSDGVAAVHALLHPLFGAYAVRSERRADALLQLPPAETPVVALPPRPLSRSGGEAALRLAHSDPPLRVGAPFSTDAHADTMPAAPSTTPTPRTAHHLTTHAYLEGLRAAYADGPATATADPAAGSERARIAAIRAHRRARGPPCWHCQARAGRYACRGCGVERYCSRACQMLAWDHGHRSACAQMKTQ